MPSSTHKQAVRYAAVVAGCFALGMVSGWSELAKRVDLYAYDVISERYPPPPAEPESVVVAIDEETLNRKGGMRQIRPILTEVLGAIARTQPQAVGLDVLLADATDPADDARLEAALHATPNLILPCELVNGKWEEPLPRFATAAMALGHVQREVDIQDGVSREIPLEVSADGVRRWALALEELRLVRGGFIVESPEDLELGGTVIPAARGKNGRSLRIRFRPLGTIPVVSALEVAKRPEMIRGKAVFIGVTALSAARDRLVNPYGDNVAGVAIHAHAFETMAQGEFVRPARDITVFLVCACFALCVGVLFAYLSGWAAYAPVFALLGFAMYLPLLFFQISIVLPYFAPVAVAWLSAAGAATYQHFFVRRQLRTTESEKSRYQQAIHWAAHEMRTPLTAIQGSSEIMSRYKLPEAKSHELSSMINAESKRLSRIIQTFLDVERLAEGQMELKQEPFEVQAMVHACLTRVTPIAERKRITISLDSEVNGTLIGDQELMEYAFYNLLTNAVKYSPPETHVRVFSSLSGADLRLEVRDQGIGMDAKELKSIFKKFYRTKRAEASGEVGTGIGLSIVEQIVTHHGGRIDVTSEPGKGSCFTMVLKAHLTNAETADRRR